MVDCFLSAGCERPNNGCMNNSYQKLRNEVVDIRKQSQINSSYLRTDLTKKLE